MSTRLFLIPIFPAALAFVSALANVQPAAAQLLSTPGEPITQGISRAATGDHTCARSDDGTVWCYGRNNDNQLGDGLSIRRGIPAPVYGVSNAAQVVVGNRHSCALKSEGTVWCWGANDTGQIGDGTYWSTSVLSGTETIGHEILVQPGEAGRGPRGPILTDTVALAAGHDHNCALKIDGTVWCWGANDTGQLGDGTLTRRPTPTLVSGLSGVAAIGAGTLHSCAIKVDGTAWCWGANSNGQLGDGSRTTRTTPVQVSGFTGAVQIAGGAAHSCARKADRTVWCWGANDTGQLGDGTYAQRLTAVQVVSIGSIDEIGIGGRHSCATQREGGSTWCWGDDSHSQLGAGSPAQLVEDTDFPPSSPRPVAVLTANGSPLTNVQWLGAGGSHSCARLSNKQVWCWGDNSHGQLGSGIVTDVCVPVPGHVNGLDPANPLVSKAELSYVCTSSSTSSLALSTSPVRTGRPFAAPSLIVN